MIVSRAWTDYFFFWEELVSVAFYGCIFSPKISPFDAGCCLLCGIWLRLLESLVASKRWIIIIINMMDFAFSVFGSQPLKRFEGLYS